MFNLFFVFCVHRDRLDHAFHHIYKFLLYTSFYSFFYSKTLLYENINANFCLTLNEFLPAYSIKRNMINQSKTKHMSIKRKFICQCLFFEIEIGIEGRGLKVIIMRRDEAFIHVYVAGDDTIVHIRQLIS
jgi:hypothetical protein